MMQQTCSRCGGLLVPGASLCNYCGTPVTSSAYPQQGSVPPDTRYGYSQTSPSADPYASQYAPVAPPPASTGSGAYGPSPFGQPSQPSPFGPPPGVGAFGSAPQPGSFGSMPPPPTRKKSPALLIGLIALIVIVLAGLGTGGYLLLKGSAPTTNGSPTPTAVPPLYHANLTSDPGSWDCTQSTSCSFQSDGYHIQATDNKVFDSLLLKQTFIDTVIEVKGIISQGDPQNAGLVIEFRVPQNNKGAGYGFFIYDDGSYSAVKWDANGNASALINDGHSSAIQGGLQQPNDLKIVISGSQFTFYDNNQQIATTSDTTYPTGYIGLAAAGQGTEAIFSNLTITKP